MGIFVDAMLLARGGQEEGTKHPLSEGMTVLGRAPQCDIELNDPGISRRHAGIRGDARGYWIRDLSSRNGTFVNGNQVGIEPRLLRNLDRIYLGTTDTAVYWIFLESQATAVMPVL